MGVLMQENERRLKEIVNLSEERVAVMVTKKADRQVMEEKLKECIWIFRSSLNKRKLWVPLTTQETYVTAYDRKLNNALDKKKTMSAVWSVIASSCTTYSKMKAAEYYKKYIKVVKQ